MLKKTSFYAVKNLQEIKDLRVVDSEIFLFIML